MSNSSAETYTLQQEKNIDQGEEPLLIKNIMGRFSEMKFKDSFFHVVRSNKDYCKLANLRVKQLTMIKSGIPLTRQIKIQGVKYPN